MPIEISKLDTSRIFMPKVVQLMFSSEIGKKSVAYQEVGLGEKIPHNFFWDSSGCCVLFKTDSPI